MKVFIKNKVFSLRGSSNVLNENKEIIYKVKGKLFSPTKKKFIYDNEGNLLYVVRNKWFKLFVHRAYIKDAEGKKIATVKRKFWSLLDKYVVEGYPDKVKIDSKFFKMDSKILKNGEEWGVITRQFSLIRDAFALEADDEDIPFLIALVIAIDNIKDRREK